MTGSVRAVLFDLYGTLLAFGDMEKGLPDDPGFRMVSGSGVVWKVIRLMSSSAHEKKELQENRGEDRMSGQPEVI